VGERTGDSGSTTGRGGVFAPAEASLYCALKDVTSLIVVVCAALVLAVLGGALGSALSQDDVPMERQRDADVRGQGRDARACPEAMRQLRG